MRLSFLNHNLTWRIYHFVAILCFVILSGPARGTLHDDTATEEYSRPVALQEELTQYDSIFEGLDRSIIGRADTDATALENNTPMNTNILPNTTTHYEFPLSTILQARSNDFHDDREQHEELRKRQNTSVTVYITINTCLQPTFQDSSIQADPPQLSLWVSQSEQNQYPGPDNTQYSQHLLLDSGYANITLPNVETNVYIGVFAQAANVSSGAWNYEIAASVDRNYHSYITGLPALYMSDSDPYAALLVTKNLSAAVPEGVNITGLPPILSLFVQQTNETATRGLEKSFCGLQKNARIQGIVPGIPSGGIETGITAYDEQIFYVPSLNATSNYTAMLAIAPNATATTPGGGGAVYNSTTFITKRLANCQVIYGLSFCSSVAYAVPANPANFSSMSDLAAQYDNSTAATYQYFNYSLQQIPCNTTPTAQYSLVKTCDDCAAAYKTWLCAVSIPRCADWQYPYNYPPYSGQQASDNNGDAIDFLMPRNAAQSPIAETADVIHPVTDPTLLNWVAFNSSRNSDLVTNTIAPGPYMEVLPCEDLCYDLVRNCPAGLGFACPKKGRGLEWSYGTKRATSDGAVTCNAPGAVWGISAGIRGVAVSWTLLLVGVLGPATVVGLL